MCLLIVFAETRSDAPLIVAANRDERLDRPAVPMTVLRPGAPKVIGGRDELAGGTWLAVNEAGVVAGLTNRPRPGGRDDTRRSRGELPLALASQPTATTAVDLFTAAVDPRDYNEAWLLVADRTTVFSVDVSGERVVAERLRPGVHILENRPLGAPSPKVDHVRSRLHGVEDLPLDQLLERLRSVLRDHEVPSGPSAGDEMGTGEVPPEVKAACVHTELYGTRWSGVITVPAGPGTPSVRYTDGPPCRARQRSADPLWR